MNKRRLVHPKLTINAIAHFPNLATINDPVTLYDDFNEPLHTYAPSTNPLLQAIPCYIEPISGATSGEQRERGNTLITNQWNVLLAGDFPQLDNTQAIDVDGTLYNIINVAIEATHTFTAIVAEQVSL